jgi:hypothetical protein
LEAKANDELQRLECSPQTVESNQFTLYDRQKQWISEVRDSFIAQEVSAHKIARRKQSTEFSSESEDYTNQTFDYDYSDDDEENEEESDENRFVRKRGWISVKKPKILRFDKLRLQGPLPLINSSEDTTTTTTTTNNNNNNNNNKSPSQYTPTGKGTFNESTVLSGTKFIIQCLSTRSCVSYSVH